jgi:hypothetical protein
MTKKTAGSAWATRKRIQTRAPLGKPGSQRPLYRVDDNGDGACLSPAEFGGNDLEGWGRSFESFHRLNEAGLKALAIRPEFESTPQGPKLILYPGDHVGAIPLRSGTSGQVVAGLVVRPRFGWSGIGSILADIGWHAAPDILSMPLVPGSGREVPPWVLAGPVVARINALLDVLKRGFDFKTGTLRAPRGTILWQRYIKESLTTGRWHHIPSRFPDLASDPVLRGAVRWTLERVIQELVNVGGTDETAARLAGDARLLLKRVDDVPRVYPRPELLQKLLRSDPLLQQALRSGFDAMGWVRDERGLGGGRQMDGLSWSLALNRLWNTTLKPKCGSKCGARVGRCGAADSERPSRLFTGRIRAIDHSAT